MFHAFHFMCKAYNSILTYFSTSGLSDGCLSYKLYSMEMIKRGKNNWDSVSPDLFRWILTTHFPRGARPLLGAVCKRWRGLNLKCTLDEWLAYAQTHKDQHLIQETRLEDDIMLEIMQKHPQWRRKLIVSSGFYQGPLLRCADCDWYTTERDKDEDGNDYDPCARCDKHLCENCGHRGADFGFGKWDQICSDCKLTLWGKNLMKKT